MPVAPTLIIGLGGTGSKVIEKVRNDMLETAREQAERIAFVAFDTDINDLSDLQRRSPNIYTVQTSTRSTVGEYLNINTNARDNWFPVNEMLNRKTLTEGAAQVRAISRLAFDTTLKAGNLDPLHQAVDQLFRIDKDQKEQALRVIITSSLAGGTGSGLILPVAMYLANFLRSKYPRAKAITRGFFIQPDVFFSVISATEEQRNLQVNAYAAVRELDAFLMKGDNTLPPQYSDLVFEFPKIGSEGVDVINAMPYDFCFLFDAGNTAGGGLTSFESYLDHAATCIYTQSLGPMSKKSNSREDNVLREVIKNDGRNRYAGAGASRLYYPWRHLRDYVAFKWADQALSLQWLTFDEQIKDRKEALAKQRQEGFAAKDINTGEEFIKLITSAAENKDPFARAIQSQCLQYDADGISVIGQRWLEYVGNLKKHVEKTVDSSGDQGLKRNAQSRVAALTGTADRNDYVAVYQELKRYHDLAERYIDENAGVIAYTLFRADSSSLTRSLEPHNLETYLREKVTNDFIHPVSARYFLYQTREVLLGEKKRIDVQLDRTLKYFENFEKTAFAGSGEAADPSSFATQKGSLRERVQNKPGASLIQLITLFGNYIKRVDDLRREKAYAKVLDEALAYVNGLAESFEIFFNALEGNLKRLRTDIDMHRTRYDDLKGSTTRYVLASSRSLDFVYRTMPYTGSVVNVDSALSEGIYLKVRAYHMLTDEKAPNYFHDLYNHEILGYFKEDVNKRHQSQLEIDVIEALEREYRATTHNFEEKNVVHYVIDEINKVKSLAAPFIEHPMGEERHPISACAYNEKIEKELDPRRKALVDEHLGNYGGQKDPDISPQEVLFYSAIYGIKASDLSKYAPERRKATDKRPAGSYFAAYHQLISGIKPSVNETRVITPHIDRRWHTIAALPDLDDEYQQRQMVEIHRALFLGLTHKVIMWESGYDQTKTYRYQPIGALDQEFVVGNGTPCDQFYEVLDSLMVDPVAVKTISSTVERRLALFLEEQQSASFEESPVSRALMKGLSLGQLESVIPGMAGRRVTLFDVPAFYAVSVPRGAYSDFMLRDLTTNILTVVRDEAQEIEHSGEATSALAPLLHDQFLTFRENSKFYLDAMGAPFARKIRTIIRPFTDLLTELRLRELQEQVEAFEISLRDL